MENASPFYNRVRERKSLADALNSPRSEMLIVYGRRGVGKSALLDQALKDANLPSLYYRATRRTLALQLEALTDAAREAFPDAFLGQSFESLTVFFDFLSHYAAQREDTGNQSPIAVVIDELPYLADVDPGLLTVIQHWWDANKRRPNLKIFLAGSYVAFMERQVLDASAPLYNRRTGALKLEALDYAEAALFFPRYSPQEKMAAYAILGGMPSYLEQFDPAQDIADNLRATVLRRNTYLSEEPDWLLLEDRRRDVTHGSILRAVATGQRKPSDIARAIGKNSAQDIAPQLASLQEQGLLIREVPITEMSQPRSRTSLYYIADNYLDFWYRYVDPARSLIARGLGERVWEQTISPNLGEYISRPSFERASRQFLWRILENSNSEEFTDLSFVNVGTWWGAGDREIDVVATNERGQVTVAGSCKWTESPMDVREYAALQSDLALAGLTLSEAPWWFLFSRLGFSPHLTEIAAAQNPRRLILVDLDQMYRV
ncbi:ATPase AAA [Capsulimonas corticalis]|uniref:ATPase AAA n=1 Tax=Capsulimonas corticalis TaxID=2219043 RepID=A0A402CU33_9BACT|nr:ATP-binding protein [Capsulimonas corticalis]BDI28848.1 ATPase AAA [Capsulimonas corticalis]